jgi:uncharacterized protein YrrD
MLHSLKDLNGYTLAAEDGEIGHVREAYFDDARWTVRHLVVETGGWLSGRSVLISPHAVRRVDHAERSLHVGLTRSQVEKAPSIDTDRPVSRQYEIAAYDFYGYPYYWGGSSLWGMMDMPMGGVIAPFGAPLAGSALEPRRDEGETAALAREAAEAERDAADPHLRSSAEVIGYDLAASDGSIGHVDDFLIDEASWRIMLLVVDTHNWLPDRLVLLPPSSVQSVDWSARQAQVRISRQAVHDSPPYTRSSPVHEDQMRAAQRHFERMV